MIKERESGFCHECKNWVYLKEDGSCDFGHPPASITTKQEIHERALRKAEQTSILSKSATQNNVAIKPEENDSNLLKCPSCSSTQLVEKTRNLSPGGAGVGFFAGALLFGPIGALLGTFIGAGSEPVIQCQNCGKVYTRHPFFGLREIYFSKETM